MGKSYQHLKITSTSSPVSLPLLRIMDKVTSFHTPCPRGHEVKILVAQSCLTLYDPVDCSPLGSSVLGISQARILEWVAISSSRRSFWLRDRTWVSCLAGGFFTTEPPGRPFTIILWRTWTLKHNHKRYFKLLNHNSHLNGKKTKQIFMYFESLQNEDWRSVE